MTTNEDTIMNNVIDKSFYNGYKCAVGEMRKAISDENRILGMLKEKKKDDATSVALCDLQISENNKKLKFLDDMEEIANNHLAKEE